MGRRHHEIRIAFVEVIVIQENVAWRPGDFLARVTGARGKNYLWGLAYIYTAQRRNMAFVLVSNKANLGGLGLQS